MKTLKLFFLAAAASLLVSSCGMLSPLGNTTATDNTSAGINAGTALAAIFGQYKKDNSTLDLGNITNIINIATIANNLGIFKQSLTDDATAAFTQGLIKGSQNLINKSNASAVLSGLQTLAGTNLSQFTKAASKAATTAESAASTALQKIDATSTQATTAVNALTGILSALKK